VALIRRQTSASDPGADVPAGSDAAKPHGVRVLSAGATGAERVARAAGVDQFVNEAVEEAVVGALRSPAVIRAVERAIESHALTAELNSEEVRQIVKRVLESDVGEAVWAEFLSANMPCL
jgi:hypothetical protein